MQENQQELKQAVLNPDEIFNLLWGNLDGLYREDASSIGEDVALKVFEECIQAIAHLHNARNEIREANGTELLGDPFGGETVQIN